MLPLLRKLTDASPRWAVWKGADTIGTGDVDSIAPASDWPALERVFIDWARATGLDAVVSCSHPPGMTILVGVGGDDSGRLIQLDVVARKQRHGALLFSAAQLEPLVELDAGGFRRLRRGAEGLLRVALDRSDRGAHGLVASDPEGAREAARAARMADAVAGVRSSRERAELEFRTLRSALGAPQCVAEGLLFDVRWRARCPVLRALRAERRIPGDPARWLANVRRSHTVHALR